VGSSPNSTLSADDDALDIAQLEWIACWMSLSSFSILSYIDSFFSPCLCKISYEASSTAMMMSLILFTVSTFCDLGLLAWVFFHVEGFYGEKLCFFDVSTSIRGSFGGVTSPFYFLSPSSPPSSWFTSSSPPPPAGESGAVSSNALSFSSLSMSYTSSFSFFFFIFALLCPSLWHHYLITIPLDSSLHLDRIHTYHFSEFVFFVDPNPF
jgi:hypothetical protein